MSAFGAGVVIATFGMLTATAFGFLPFPTLFLSVPLLSVAALCDSWRNSRAKQRKAKSQFTDANEKIR